MAETRDRIVTTTAELFRRYGYTGTGMKRIVQDSAAPYGSIYHFFPGGKEDLAREVIVRSGAAYRDLVTAVMDAEDDVLASVGAIFEGAAIALEATDFADACPIATVALEVASANEPLRLATAEVFEDWLAAATVRFEAAGLAPDRAREHAITVLCLLEGAFVFCRSLRSTEPLHAAGRAAVAATRTALAEAT
ncbi:TetR/AcrR family transcriptional regulator [Nitriliruptor alkaliphilus]|uniref:TetR/AcrR family transcriptional regulator n=1 Tax=Nitriliruptor alkaliphilus TaxID=427918 RepID=UPI000698478A|nr:TetR/AcrR family transcriptional regulator [Nitriliruptor alkaliphilus]